jgi:hypothetical protein
MKKILLAIFTFCSAFSVMKVQAQATFTVPLDTVVVTINKAGGANDNVMNITGNDVTIKWTVVACNFPMDWLTMGAFGICDDNTCYPNASNQLWNKSAGSGNTFTAIYHHNSTHDSTEQFSLSMNLAGSDTIGTFYVTVNLKDNASGNSKDVTFLLSKTINTVGVNPVSNVQNDIILYPNPAINEVNVVYDDASDIRNIVVYSIIGKVMAVYKVNGNSANMNLENIPSGIYFMRLYNGAGNVVATKKFTKQ